MASTIDKNLLPPYTPATLPIGIPPPTAFRTNSDPNYQTNYSTSLTQLQTAQTSNSSYSYPERLKGKIDRTTWLIFNQYEGSPPSCDEFPAPTQYSRTNQLEVEKSFDRFCKTGADHLWKSPNNVAFLYFHFRKNDKDIQQYLEVNLPVISQWDTWFAGDELGSVKFIEFIYNLIRFDTEARFHVLHRGHAKSAEELEINIGKMIKTNFLFRPILCMITLDKNPIREKTFGPHGVIESDAPLTGTTHPPLAAYPTPGPAVYHYFSLSDRRLPPSSKRVFDRNNFQLIDIDKSSQETMIESLCDFAYRHNVTDIFVTEEPSSKSSFLLNQFIGNVPTILQENVRLSIPSIHKVERSQRVCYIRESLQKIRNISKHNQYKLVVWFVNHCNTKGQLSKIDSLNSALWEFFVIPDTMAINYDIHSLAQTFDSQLNMAPRPSYIPSPTSSAFAIPIANAPTPAYNSLPSMPLRPISSSPFTSSPMPQHPTPFSSPLQIPSLLPLQQSNPLSLSAPFSSSINPATPQLSSYTPLPYSRTSYPPNYNSQHLPR